MTREENNLAKLMAARRELIMRQRILASAQRGVEKVLRQIEEYENKLK
jgi:hypothetical protein